MKYVLSLALSVATCAAFGLSTATSAIAQDTAAPATTEQIAAAKKQAVELGGRLKEDAQGHVIALDMAAGRTWADDYQMQQILVFPTLTTLVVEGPGITDQLIPRIAAQQKLASLTLKNTLVSDRGIAQLTGLKDLKIIELRVAPMITDRAMEALAKIPTLRAVRLVGGNITDRGVATLLQLPQLAELDVRNCRGVTQVGIAKTAAKQSLRVLKIGGPRVNDEALAIVGSLTNLKGLGLDNCDISDAGLAKLAPLPLEDLTIYQCPNISDAGLKILGRYDRLRQLTLQGVAAKGECLTALPAPAKLTKLNLAQSGVTDATVANLPRFTELASLNLSQTNLTDAAVDALAKLKSLKQLILTQTRITESSAQRLHKALPGCSIRTN